MKRRHRRDVLILAGAVCLGVGPDLVAASYSLRWSGPTTLTAGEDGVARARFTTWMSVGSTPSPGVLGWSLSVFGHGEHLRITNATISGTAVEAHIEGATVAIEPHEPALGKGYRVSVLFPEPKPLLALMHDAIPVLHVDVELDVPFPQSFGSLRHGNSMAPESRYRSLVIESAGEEVLRPALRDYDFSALHRSICGDLVLGFSAKSLDTGFPFEGVLGAPGGSGSVVFTSPPGTVETAHVDLVTLYHPEQSFESPVWGWELSVALEGDADPVGVSFQETPAGRYFMSGFEKTSIVDPVINGGRKGFTSAVLLTISQPSRYPNQGSLSILKVDVLPTSTPGAASLRFVDGLQWRPRTPVTNQFLIQGSHVPACNLETASLEMTFSAGDARFRRGDDNGDGRINVSDAISILRALIENGGEACLASRDVNADRKVDLTDAIHLLTYLFQGGAAPAEPSAVCGADPAGGLGCLEEPQTCR